MDPNENLRETREVVRRILDAVDRADPETGAWQDDAYRLAELAESMDTWLTGGGFPPADWACMPLSARSQ